MGHSRQLFFAKPNVSQQYLYAKSSNPFHTIKHYQSCNFLEFVGFVLSHQNTGNMQLN